MTQLTDKDAYFLKKDIDLARNNRGRELNIKKKYDVKLFWEDIGDKYYPGFTRDEAFLANVPWILDRLKVLNQETLLDVGCGFARLAPFILESGYIKSYSGCDISKSVLDSSNDYLNPKPTFDSISHQPVEPKDYRTMVNLRVDDIRCLSYESNSYDIVLVNEVIQHLEPKEYVRAIDEVIRVARNYVIFIERFAFDGEHPEPHLWSHNILKIVNDRYVKVLQSTALNQTTCAIVIEKLKD